MAGVDAWRATLAALREQSGLTPVRAIALCRYFGDHRQQLKIGPGKLVYRLQNDRPDWQVHEHWGGSTGAAQTISPDELATAERHLRDLSAQELSAFAEQVLGTPNYHTALQFFREDGLKNATARETLTRALAARQQQEASL